jgi:hypothetical protein
MTMSKAIKAITAAALIVALIATGEACRRPKLATPAKAPAAVVVA